MAKEKQNKVVGNSFEDLNIDEMSNIQGAGDTEAEGWKSVVKSVSAVLEISAASYELSKGLTESIWGD